MSPLPAVKPLSSGSPIAQPVLKRASRPPLRATGAPFSATIPGSTKKTSVAKQSALTLSLAAAMYLATVAKTTAGPVPEDAPAKAHHVKGDNGETVRFKNPHPSASEDASLLGNLSRIFRAKFRGELATPSTANHKIPFVKPIFLPTRSPTSAPTSSGSSTSPTAPGSLRATWLGHACVYIEFPSGLRVLFDPVFEPRCSPVSWLGPRRYTPPPCRLSDLPHIDAVVISHSHYDHLSLPSIKEVAAKHPDAHFFTGLGLARWFRASGINDVTELDWWEDVELKLAARKQAEHKRHVEEESEQNQEPPSPSNEPQEITATFSCLPCQHTSGRTSADKDRTLWASWAVSSGGKSVFFGGDTGYRAVPPLPATEDDYGPAHASLPRNPDFKKIGSLRGPFDLGLIPIGAYKPRWVFSGQHANPFDAVEIFKDTACRRALGIHWGTWTLTSEDVDEPPRLLAEALRRSGLPEFVFDVCALGESREF